MIGHCLNNQVGIRRGRHRPPIDLRLQWWVTHLRTNILINDAICFALDEPGGIDEPGNLHERACWPYFTEKLAMSTGCISPLRNIGEHYSYSNNLLQCSAGIADRLLNDLEAANGLAINVAGGRCAASDRNRRGP